MAEPNPCRTPACRERRPRPLPIVETDENGGAMVRCPACKASDGGDDRADAIAEWNAMNPRRRSPWPYIVAAVVIAALLWGASHV